MKTYDVVVQLGSQVKFIRGGTAGHYELAPHTEMRTRAAAGAINAGIAPRLIIVGGSNFGVRYDDQRVFNDQHPTQKKSDFSFEAFAASDFSRKSEAAVIKDTLVSTYGMDPCKVLAETLSATTEENAEFLKIILQRRPDPKSPKGILGVDVGSERIGILTLMFHMERALPIFRSAGLNVEPVLAEDVLAMSDNREDPMPGGNINQICEYYSTPKGGKQYDVGRMRQLLTAGRSLAEMME